jgi:hypothetical protein
VLVGDWGQPTNRAARQQCGKGGVCLNPMWLDFIVWSLCWLPAQEKDDLQTQLSQLQAEQSELEAQIRQAEMEVEQLAAAMITVGARAWVVSTCIAVNLDDNLSDLSQNQYRKAVAVAAQKTALAKAATVKTTAFAQALDDMTATLDAACRIHVQESRDTVGSAVSSLLDEVATHAANATSSSTLPDVLETCFRSVVGDLQESGIAVSGYSCVCLVSNGLDETLAGQEPATVLERVRSSTLEESRVITTETSSLDLASDAARLRYGSSPSCPEELAKILWCV